MIVTFQDSKNQFIVSIHPKPLKKILFALGMSKLLLKSVKVKNLFF